MGHKGILTTVFKSTIEGEKIRGRYRLKVVNHVRRINKKTTVPTVGERRLGSANRTME